MAVTVCPQLHFKRSERDSQGQASTRRPDARPSSASHLPGEKQNPDGVRCGSSESQTSCPNSPIPVRGDEHLCSRSSGERTSLQRLPEGGRLGLRSRPEGSSPAGAHSSGLVASVSPPPLTACTQPLTAGPGEAASVGLLPGLCRAAHTAHPAVQQEGYNGLQACWKGAVKQLS